MAKSATQEMASEICKGCRAKPPIFINRTFWMLKKQKMSSGEPMARAVVGWECAPS